MQNHLLQILALFAMETPVSLDAEDIRNEKVSPCKNKNKNKRRERKGPGILLFLGCFSVLFLLRKVEYLLVARSKFYVP